MLCDRKLIDNFSKDLKVLESIISDLINILFFVVIFLLDNHCVLNLKGL